MYRAPAQFRLLISAGSPRSSGKIVQTYISVKSVLISIA